MDLGKLIASKIDIETVILKQLLTPEVKLKVCTLINESVNIPIINEKTEQRVFEAIWDIFEVTVREQLQKSLK